MKIAFLAGANSIHSIRWIKYFSDKGHKIIWISLAPPITEATELIKKVNFYEIKPSPLADINGKLAIFYLPLTVKKVRKILKNEKPDIFHVHSIGTYGLVGALSGFHPLILTAWGSYILLSRKLKKILVRYAIRQGDYYTCDGYNAEKRMVTLGADPKKLEQIRFGIDTSRFTTIIRKRKEENIKVISIRNLEPLYDVESVIRAAQITTREIPPIEFIIAGDGSERKRLEGLARELGTEKYIKFTGRYEEKNLLQMLSEADIYVSTSLSESGLAASTSEAMAAGLPLIVSDSGDNKIWIEGKGGFVIPTRNPKLMAEKILYLARNESMRKQFGAYNRKITFEKNDYRTEMGKMENMYEKLLSRSNK